MRYEDYKGVVPVFPVEDDICVDLLQAAVYLGIG